MSASDQLSELARVIGVTVEGQVLWFGKPVPGITIGRMEDPLPDDRLEKFLYENYYSQGSPARLNRLSEGLHHRGSRPSRVTLDRDNALHCWQPRWTLLAQTDDRFLLARDGLAVWFDAANVRTTPQVGEMEAWLPLLRPNLSPGYQSLTTGYGWPLNVEVRVYWSLNIGAVDAFTKHVLALVIDRSVPMSAKVASRPEMFTRADAAVMYMSEATYHSIITDLQRIHGSLVDHIKPSTPALCLKLAHGVGLAESPTDGRSFGQFMCTVLSHGVIRMARGEGVSVSDKVAALRREISAAGLDLEAPHLRSLRRSCPYGSWQPEHAAQVAPQQVVRTEDRTPSTFREETTRSRALHTAEAIGGLIVGRALTTSTVCTWVGGTAATYHDDPNSTQYRSLGGALYDGTAGVAVFLAALARATDNSEAADVAHRALRFARTAEAIDGSRAGLYDGSSGVIVAADMVRNLTGAKRSGGSPEAVRLGLLAAAESACRDSSNVDLFSGRSGVILALLSRLPVLSRRERDAAVELGCEVLATAVNRRAGIGWMPPRSIATRPLTGMSHGVAGIALALTALAETTGQKRFHHAAVRAIEYEDSLFDASVGNWPDLRRPIPELTGGGRPAALSFWCHGAPGILLSRVLIAKLKPATSRAYMTEALANTRAAIRESLATTPSDMSLCHGLFGLVDILLHSTSMPGDRSPEDLDLIRDSVDCAARVIDSGGTFRCGTHGGETPSAMLGLAGIGMTLLRIHDDSLPSLLNPTRVGSA